MQDALKRVTNVRIGPLISKGFFKSAAPYLLSSSSFAKMDAGQWPNWYKPPKAVLYRMNGTDYFLITVWENGGWRVVGSPGSSQASWLKSSDYSTAAQSSLKSENR
jgi:hypothetical protein